MNKDNLMYIILFLISFFFCFFFIYGLPIHLYADVSTLLYSKINTPYTELITNIFFGRSPSFISSHNDVIARPTLVFVSKLFYNQMDPEGVLLYMSRILTICLISLFLCYFLYLGTSNRTLSFLGGFFYVTLPPVFSATWLYSDAQVLADLFICIALFMFYKFVYNEKDISVRSSIFLFGFTAALIISLKTKESAKLILPVFFLLICFYYRKKIILFIPSFVYIIFLIFSVAGTNGPSIFDFSPNGVYTKIIASSGSDYAPEVITLFSLTQHFRQVPIAMLSQLGFFFGWFFVFTFIFYLYRKSRDITRVFNTYTQLFKWSASLDKQDFPYGLTIIWLMVTILSYGFLSTYVEHRYYAGGMLPLTLFIFLTTDKTLSLILSINMKKLFFRLFIFLTIFTIAVNSYHIAIDIRGGVIGYWEGYYEAQKYLFLKHSNNKYPEESLQAFLWRAHTPDNFSEIAYVLNYTYTTKASGWIRHISTFNESVVGPNITVYFITVNTNTTPLFLNETDYLIEYENAFGGCFDNSFYCALKDLIKKPERTHFLYNVTNLNS